MRMRRGALFVVIEAFIFIAAESANALAIAPIPRSDRLGSGLAIAALFALGFVVPRTTRGRLVVLILNGLFLGLMAAFSGLAMTVAVLLPLRSLRLQPCNRAGFVVCTAFGLCVFALSSVIGTYAEHRPVEALGAALLLPFYAMILSLVALSEDLRTSRAALAAANAELALRAERWQRIATLNDRYQLGSDLERVVGDGLRSIGEELERVLSEGGPSSQVVHTFRAQRTAGFTLAHLENAVAMLRKAAVQESGVAVNLVEMCKAFSRRGIATVTTDIANVSLRDPISAASLERIATEALINVARHSDASHVEVSLRVVDRHIELTIKDDGIGFDRAAARAGQGITTMRDQAALAGGECLIESMPSRGTAVKVTIPLAAP
jgi:signal transduction histidine kinase